MSTHTAATAVVLKRGDAATTKATPFAEAEAVRIVRAEYLDHPAYVDVDGPIPARRERWLHVEHADGGRVLMHPSNLEAARPLLEVLAEHVAQVTAGRAVTTA